MYSLVLLDKRVLCMLCRAKSWKQDTCGDWFGKIIVAFLMSANAQLLKNLTVKECNEKRDIENHAACWGSWYLPAICKCCGFLTLASNHRSTSKSFNSKWHESTARMSLPATHARAEIHPHKHNVWLTQIVFLDTSSQLVRRPQSPFPCKIQKSTFQKLSLKLSLTSAKRAKWERTWGRTSRLVLEYQTFKYKAVYFHCNDVYRAILFKQSFGNKRIQKGTKWMGIIEGNSH